VVKRILLAVILLAVVAGAALTYFIGSPRDVYGFLRYALPQWHRGELRVGDTAPDAKLVALDGSTFHLRDRIGRRPLVLVFGSYT
jgi:hypothetical protein